jgi:hypothetical protein
MNANDRLASAAAALRALDGRRRVPAPDLPYAEVLNNARHYLGPFESLPVNLRADLIELCQGEEAVRTLSQGVLSRGLVYSGALLSRFLYGAERLAGRLRVRASPAWKTSIEMTRKFLRRTARQSTHMPAVTRRWLHRLSATVQLWMGRRELATILRSTGFDTRTLEYEYLEGLQQIRGCESVIKRRGVTFTQLIGIDFIQSDGRFWFLEANYNPALMDARLALYEPDQDPWVKALINCARARGLQRIVVYGYRPFSPGHAEALIAGGRKAGVEVTVVDDLFSSRYSVHQRAWLMENGAVGEALVVRAKGFGVLFDRALLSKQQTRRIVEQSPIDWRTAGVALPRLLAPGGEAPNYRPDSRYPNIVAKVDGLDRGAGVTFYKLPRVPQAAHGEADYFEEYHHSDPCLVRLARGKSMLVPDAAGRPWKIRSYALLTPENVEYLSSIKVISGRAVPAQLPEGIVAERNIYLATINEGGGYSACTADEEDACKRAAQAIGEALLEWLRRKYAADFAVPATASATGAPWQ